jgi:hypothetical protein
MKKTKLLIACFALLSSRLASAQALPNLCSTTGPQRIAVVLANYPGAPFDSATPHPDYIRELFLGIENDFSVSDFYKTISGSRTVFQSVQIAGPYEVPAQFVVDLNQNAGIDRALDQWESDLVERAGSDIDFTQIDRVVFITPNAIDLKGAPVGMGDGMAEQGDCNLDSISTSGVHHLLAHAWVRARLTFQGVDYIVEHSFSSGMIPTSAQIQAAVRRQEMLDMAPIIHELGHTFGLGHANQVNRPSTGLVNPFQNDEILPAAEVKLWELGYADPFSAMGAGEIQWFNLAHLSQLGWLNNDQIKEVRTEGTYRIYPLELQDGKLKGLKIPRVVQSVNESTVSELWVEYRKRSTVYDTELTGITHTTDGAIVHYTNPNQPNSDVGLPFETVLLNFQDDHTVVNTYETNLTLTKSWKDDHSLVNLEVIDVTPDYIDVHVSFSVPDQHG